MNGIIVYDREYKRESVDCKFLTININIHLAELSEVENENSQV